MYKVMTEFFNTYSDAQILNIKALAYGFKGDIIKIKDKYSIQFGNSSQYEVAVAIKRRLEKHDIKVKILKSN